MPAGRPRGSFDHVGFALRHLQKMRLPSGLYCHDWVYGQDQRRGESVRYSLMVLLGLQRAAAAGIAELPDDPDALWRRCLGRQDRFSPGDIGLALWADSRSGAAAADELVAALRRAIPDDRSLAPLVGMEIAWMILGLAEAASTTTEAEGLLRRIVGHLRKHRRAKSGLYFHDASSRIRRRLPNFATEIYTLAALTSLARHDLDDRARTEAEDLGTILLRLQLDDGGWPWLFDADRATVVERYEIYSVHQDAMAPMALLPLTDLTGDTRWRDAAVSGLEWSLGGNELGISLFDEDRGFAHRSIRRRPPWDRLALWTGGASVRATGRVVALSFGGVELNTTSRPYHLGWMLEAWAGRGPAADNGDA